MQSTQHRSSVLARLGVARYALHIPVSFYDHTVARDPYVHETGIPGPRRHTLTATQSDTLIRPSLVAVAQTYGRHCVNRFVLRSNFARLPTRVRLVAWPAFC